MSNQLETTREFRRQWAIIQRTGEIIRPLDKEIERLTEARQRVLNLQYYAVEQASTIRRNYDLLIGPILPSLVDEIMVTSEFTNTLEDLLKENEA